MAVQKIVIWPSETLSQVSEEVSWEALCSARFRQLVEDMQDTMAAHHGVGLAAIQIGVPLRIFVMDARGATRPTDNILSAPQVFINPRMIELIDEPVDVDESCLSLPGCRERARRHPEVIVEATNKDGYPGLYQLAGIEAQCAQHEMEHLDGKIFVDAMGFAKRDLLKRKIQKTLRHRRK